MRARSSASWPSLKALAPADTLSLGVGGLSLSPRIKVLLTFFRSDPSVRPIDEWQLRRALIDFLREPLGLSVPEDDLLVHRRPDLNKRKREEPVASGVLFIRDLEAFKKKSCKYDGRGLGGKDGAKEDPEGLRKEFLGWRDSVVGRMDGIELNLEGVKFRLTVELPPSEDFDRLKKSWEEDFFASQSSVNRYSSRGVIRRPDTLVISGVPSRWFAEPRVSSKPSMLVTHTIFSVLGRVRNLHVACDEDPSKTAESKGDFLSGLHCKVWVQFEDYDEFCNATRVLCGHSMQKEGSRLKAEYDVSWDRDGFFKSIQQRPSSNRIVERSEIATNPLPGREKIVMQRPTLQSEVARVVSARVISDGAHRKRFRE